MGYYRNMVRIKVKRAATWFKKIIGLIGEKDREPLYIETRWGIHTFGVRKPIDIVILDEDDLVVAIKQNLQPNHIFLWNPRYYRVLELPEETIKDLALGVGQKVTLKYY